MTEAAGSNIATLNLGATTAADLDVAVAIANRDVTGLEECFGCCYKE